MYSIDVLPRTHAHKRGRDRVCVCARVRERETEGGNINFHLIYEVNVPTVLVCYSSIG